MPQFEPALLEQIKQLVPISRLVGEYVAADGKSTPGDLWGLCPFHGERTPSFHAEDSQGIYKCFGCGAAGDHFQFLQEHQGMTFPQAVEAVADRAGVTLPGTRSEPSTPGQRARYEAPEVVDPYAGYTYAPAPAYAPLIFAGKRTPKLRNPKQANTGKFETTYIPNEASPYYNADGELLGYVLRIDKRDGGKITPGIWWMRCDDGWEGWSHGSLPSPRPLENLPAIIANPDYQVLVVAGERKRRMAAEALAANRIVVISWMGGDNSVAKTDWKPLAGRSILWWPDNDASGYVGMAQAMERAKGGTNKWVKSYCHEHAGDKDYSGKDVADLIEDGGNVAAYIKANISLEPLLWVKMEIAAKRGKGGEDGTMVHRGDDADHPASSETAGHNDANEQPSGPSNRTSQVHEQDQGSENGGGIERAVGICANPHEEIDPLEHEWEEHLKFTKDGSGLDKSSLHNASLILQYHELFKGIFAYNAFSKEIFLMRRPTWDMHWRGKRVARDTDITACASFMETIEHGGVKPRRSDMEAVIARVAEFNQFNPVLEAMEALVWDGIPRLQGGTVGKRTFAPFGTRYLGCENTKINRAFFTKALIGITARVYQPGCKLDTTIILEGGQGAGKSTAIRELSDGLIPGVFTDEIADPGSKDAGLQMQGKLIIEFSEMASFRKSDNETVKGWLSRQNDRFRPPFGKSTVEFPRCCAFFASVNPPPSGYLRDPTGARRFWPVRVGEIDMGLLKEDAAQIWAEAKHLYQSGMKWHLEGDEVKLAETVQHARLEGDPWAALIDDYLSGPQASMKATVRVAEIMGNGCLNIATERRSSTHTARIEAHLDFRGWVGLDKGVYKRPMA